MANATAKLVKDTHGVRCACILACCLIGCSDLLSPKSIDPVTVNADRSFEIDAGIVPVGATITRYQQIPEEFAGAFRTGEKLRSSCECVRASVTSYSLENNEKSVLELQIDGGEEPIANAADVVVELSGMDDVEKEAICRVRMRFCKLRTKGDSE